LELRRGAVGSQRRPLVRGKRSGRDRRVPGRTIKHNNGGDRDQPGKAQTESKESISQKGEGGLRRSPTKRTVGIPSPIIIKNAQKKKLKNKLSDLSGKRREMWKLWS